MMKDNEDYWVDGLYETTQEIINRGNLPKYNNIQWTFAHIHDTFAANPAPMHLFRNEDECRKYLESQNIFVPDTEFMKESIRSSSTNKISSPILDVNAQAGTTPGVWRQYICDDSFKVPIRYAIGCLIQNLTFKEIKMLDDNTLLRHLRVYSSIAPEDRRFRIDRGDLKAKTMLAFAGFDVLPTFLK